MNKIVKTVVILLAGLTLTAGTAYAAPHRGGCRPAPVHHRCPPPPPHHHRVVHHHECGTGLVAGLVGGIVGGIVGALAR